MNARDKLNAWRIGAALMAGVFLLNLTGSGSVCMIVTVLLIVWALSSRGIR